MGNIYISGMCCGFVVNNTCEWWRGWGETADTSVVNTQQKFVYMQRCSGSMPVTPLSLQIIVTLLKLHC